MWNISVGDKKIIHIPLKDYASVKKKQALKKHGMREQR